MVSHGHLLVMDGSGVHPSFAYQISAGKSATGVKCFTGSRICPAGGRLVTAAVAGRPISKRNLKLLCWLKDTSELTP